MISKKIEILIFINFVLLFSTTIVKADIIKNYGYKDYDKKCDGDVIGRIKFDKKNFTIRKLEQRLVVLFSSSWTYGVDNGNRLNARELPNLTSRSLFQFKDWDVANVIAVTDEKETVDGWTERWFR